MLDRLAYWGAAHAPTWATRRLQDLVARHPRARRVVRRATGSLRSGVFTIASGPASGLRIDVAGSRPSYVTGRVEEHLQRELAAWLRPGDVLYDLGANIGFITLVGARLVGAAGRVYAYEPLPANIAALRRNVALNELRQVEVVEAAVADRAGTARFAAGASDQNGRLGAAAGDFDVRTVAIDDEIAAGKAPPTVVKLDVEGAELAALSGMRRTLEAHRPTVICEVHIVSPDSDHAVPAMLRELGYVTSWLAAEEGDDHWAPHLLAVAADRAGRAP